ncbi:MAG: UDP-N-acetylglucosamine--N-acetylmuramyl-(pentapeptide) pyrophosphoryl-undecaprenol N-acetylglucosamine transferase [Planctomycetes bacterium]|nr:UDP-N-acetylglucosamine--N-acetylmuramyl-(pentapeptide) pyrophosphoryl-undecaprenol N-acetylglucosamine transferase [Planctomycetota bacterium]
MNAPRIAIAGGGTGGHIAPALALAEELSDRFGSSSVHLLCGGNALERKMLGHAGFDFTTLPVKRPQRSLRSKATTVITTALAVPAARKAIKNFGADALVCVGGYAGLPGAMAASLLRIPVFSLEANAVPGKVTRTISRFARVCYAHMPLTRELDCRVEVVGNPIRSSFRTPPDKSDAKRALGLDSSLPTLLVIGGSQGAQGLNDAILNVGPLLGPLKDRFQILHITGAGERDRAERAWRRLRVRHRVTAFTHNTATWFAATDVALTRSGAGTISELLAMSVPMLMVPYPHAADDHQQANALWVASADSGVVIPQDDLVPERLLELIETYLLSDVNRARAAQAAQQMASPNACATILDRILGEIGLSTPAPDADEKGRAAA